MRYETIVKTAPVTEPVTLAEAKDQLRLTSLFTADDAYITKLIPVARNRVEDYCNRYFTDQTVLIVLKEWEIENGSIVLPFPDLVSVDSVKFTANGAETTIDAGDYTFDPDTRRVYNATGWPTYAVEMKFEVTTAAPVEFEGAKHAMLMLVTDMYENRTESVVGTSVGTNPAVKAMLYPYRFNLGV